MGKVSSAIKISVALLAVGAWLPAVGARADCPSDKLFRNQVYILRYTNADPGTPEGRGFNNFLDAVRDAVRDTNRDESVAEFAKEVHQQVLLYLEPSSVAQMQDSSVVASEGELREFWEGEPRLQVMRGTVALGDATNSVEVKSAVYMGSLRGRLAYPELTFADLIEGLSGRARLKNRVQGLFGYLLAMNAKEFSCDAATVTKLLTFASQSLASNANYSRTPTPSEGAVDSDTTQLRNAICSELSTRSPSAASASACRPAAPPTTDRANR